jgi:hypothetical protein
VPIERPRKVRTADEITAIRAAIAAE